MFQSYLNNQKVKMKGALNLSTKFLSDPGVLGSDLCVPISVTERGLANLTDVTLADQATNSIQADNANMAIQGNVAMKVTQSSGQLWNQCKRRHPLTKF